MTLKTIIRTPFILLIRLYQLTLSPLLGGSKCIYQPTCSHYMIGAIEEWGVLKGIYLGTKRILRCHPWSKHPMYDPVPKKEV
ncbi:MAG: membrane protein insertion efficiency factor YidD [Saprospiraceae bacterium]|nr:membrane protein insertion efficiency factor YidD [Saprospiraceae bacterium]